jgi:hypothetical protein
MTVRCVELAVSAPTASDVLKDVGKDWVNLVLDFTDTGYVVVEESYDEGANWFVSCFFSQSETTSFKNTEAGTWFRFRVESLSGSVYCRMSAS